jgi:two-component system, LytTR family, sensor kinase
LPVSFLHIKKYRLVFAGGFLLLIAVQLQVLVSLGLDFRLALWDSAVTNALIAAGCMLITNNLRYYLPKQGQYAILAVWCLALCGVCSLVQQAVLKYVMKNEPAYLQMLENSSTIRFWMSVLIVSWVAAVSLLWYRQQENREAEKRQADAEKLARDAELYKLRQQLQPHFLFNSLNSISALAGSHPEQARKMIHQLSDFLRGTLRKEEHQWVTLSDELDHLRLYLEIEKVRFGHRLSTVIMCDEETGKLQLPPMLLQPIVENAIKFGLYDTTGSITVNIVAKNNSGALEIAVSNPFDAETAGPQQGTGFGLSSVQRRLYLLFARKDLLNTKVEENLFITTVKIPQQHESNFN